MSINETDFKLIDKIEPPVAAGEYNFTAKQTIKQKGVVVAEYEASQDYAVTRRAFTMDAGEVFGVYPANGASGDFAATLPFITFANRSLPWTFGQTPFVALIVLKNDEILNEDEISISELFTPILGTFFPQKKDFPTVYAEDEADLCRVVDISAETYSKIFPEPADISLLAHAKLVDLSKSPDDVCARDGYFSVVIANRFVPSGGKDETVSTCHLVTTFEHGGGVPADCSRVRLVSLHKWSIRSKTQGGRPFTELITGLSENCCETGRGKEGGATVVKPHYTRTGETTYSLYHSPLIPYKSDKIPQLKAARTADGRLIYDKETGVFDVSYAAAFQLGRLITLSKPETAAKVLSHRNDSKLCVHKAALNAEEKADFKLIGQSLLDYEKKGKCL